jgi:hypothetical protein
LKIGPNFFLQHLKNKIILNFEKFVTSKKSMITKFFHPSLLLLFLDPGSEIRDPGWVKIRIRDPDKHPGSATLTKCKAQLSFFPVMWSRNYLSVNANMDTGTVQNGREL